MNFYGNATLQTLILASYKYSSKAYLLQWLGRGWMQGSGWQEAFRLRWVEIGEGYQVFNRRLPAESGLATGKTSGFLIFLHCRVFQGVPLECQILMEELSTPEFKFFAMSNNVEHRFINWKNVYMKNVNVSLQLTLSRTLPSIYTCGWQRPRRFLPDTSTAAIPIPRRIWQVCERNRQPFLRIYFIRTW